MKNGIALFIFILTRLAGVRAQEQATSKQYQLLQREVARYEKLGDNGPGYPWAESPR